MKRFAPPPFVPSFSETHALKCELAGEVLRSCGRLRLQVTGWSMLPSVWPGDTLMIERVNFDEVSEGEIVLIGRDRRLMAHRVVGRGHNTVLTRGDAMAPPDGPAGPEELLGRVSFILRDGRRLAPRMKLQIWERLVAVLVSRSEFGARVVVKIHEFCAASRPQTSSDRAVPCQS